MGHLSLRRMILGALVLSIAGLVLAAASAPARAQSDFPNHPVRLIVGFAAGGGNDIFARLVGGKLSEILGQPEICPPPRGGRQRGRVELSF